MPEVDRVLDNRAKLRAHSYLRARRRRPAGSRRDRGAIWSTASRAGRAPFCRSSRAATIAAPSASSPTPAAPAARCRSGPIAEQARRLVAAGYREIVLTGVDLTAYGADLPGAPSLGQMARRLLARGAGTGAAAALLARPGRDRRRAVAALRRGAAADAASASVVAGRRRSDPEADEAPAFARRGDRGRPPRPGAASGSGARRRSDRRVPDRDRGQCFAAASTSSPNAGSPLSMCFRTARGPAPRPRACRRLPAAWSRSARRDCGRQARRRSPPSCARASAARREVLIERPGIGRAAFYAAVGFADGAEAGSVRRMRLVGSDARRLVGVPVA